MRLRVLLSTSLALIACEVEAPPEQARSPMLRAVGLRPPAGAERRCERWYRETAAGSRPHHWECSRERNRDSLLDPGPWTEERVVVTLRGEVESARRTWVVPDTLRWVALADSIGASLAARGAREIRCPRSLAPVGLRTWFLDSAFLVLQAFAVAFESPRGFTTIPVRFELELRARPKGVHTCIPFAAPPRSPAQPAGRTGELL
jgi:hypothetical protein